MLKEIERDLTGSRIHELLQNPIKGDFDLKHMQEIHKYIFQDVYKWAGQTRNVDISKENSTFCKALNINDYQNSLFKKLNRDIIQKNLNMDQFISLAAEHLGEINALHPFREGNGRTQREFMRVVALEKGFVLDFDDKKISQERMIDASIKAMRENYTELKNIIKESISPLLPLEQTYQKYINSFLEEYPGATITPSIDAQIAKTILKQGYNPSEVVNFLADNSPCTSSYSNIARDYAKSTVKHAEKEIKTELSKSRTKAIKRFL